MKIRCIIVDDEHLARQLMESYVKKLPQLALVKTCKNPLEALEVLQTDVVDLMFLDIQMPDLTGIELLQSLSKRPAVIFTSAYSEYALEGYQLDVLDYLVKPFPFERFVKAVNKASEFIQLKRDASQNTAGPEATAAATQKNFLTVKADYKIHKLNFDDIMYIEGLKEYVVIHTKAGKITTLESLKRLESTLPPERFLRIHKSYIVSLDQISALEGNMVHVAKKMLPIGKSYRKQVLEKVL